MLDGKRIVVFVPAFDTAKPLATTLRAIPRPLVDQVIVVDDGSRDNSAEVGRSLGATVIRHGENRGYGAAQKSGIPRALESGADVVVMVHSDFQYDPTLVPAMVAPIVRGEADACFGSRMVRKRGALEGGMPWWRFAANVSLTQIEELVLRLGLSEYHTGYRAYSREVLERIPFALNSDNYVFDTEMIAQLRVGRFRVTEIAVPTRYAEESCSPPFWKSVRYGLSTLLVLVRYLLHTWRLSPRPQFVMGTFSKPTLRGQEEAVP
jgi:glycosyltransferase involved in cell wall biosynthesis